jgi:hypothetical protein
VIILGLSLQSLQTLKPFRTPTSPVPPKGAFSEGFNNDDTYYQRQAEDGDMTGYVQSTSGDANDVFRPDSGQVQSQLKNVPTSKEYVIGRINKYKSHVPLNHSDKNYNIGTMDDEIIQKFVRGTNPEIILNPDSHTQDQITCDLDTDCEEYVRNSQLYCPIGIDRLKTQESTGSKNEQKYQGCYTLTRDYPLLACKDGDRFNYCNYLRDLRVQRVGRGFYVFPTFDAILSAWNSAESSQEKRKISFIWRAKENMVREMILSFDHDEVKRNYRRIVQWRSWRTTGSSVIDQYARQILYNSFLLYQSKTTKSPTRIGFIMRSPKDTASRVRVGHVPELSTPTTRHSYNLKNVRYVHDTTMDPMPILHPRINRPKTLSRNQISTYTANARRNRD